MKNKKVLFIHIPKTGGTSIFNFLEKNNLDQWIRKYPHKHDPYFFMKKSNNILEDVFTFSIVRSPYTRTYSYYKHFNYYNNLNYSFNEFLVFVKNKGIPPKGKSLNLPLTTPMVLYNQSFYLLDEDNKIKLSKVYTFENLKEFEEDFQTNLPYLHKGNYLKSDYYNDYNEENISLVEQIYSEDFQNLNYEKKFYEYFK